MPNPMRICSISSYRIREDQIKSLKCLICIRLAGFCSDAGLNRKGRCAIMGEQRSLFTSIESETRDEPFERQQPKKLLFVLLHGRLHCVETI